MGHIGAMIMRSNNPFHHPLHFGVFTMTDTVYDKGLATRKAVLGADYVQGAFDRSTDFTRPLQKLVTEHAWGNTWQRDGISLKTRSIVTVSMLVALGRMHELKIHVRGALNNGVTKEELQEIFMHASVYCGFPAAVDAFRTASEVVDAIA
jgi:4-carboxymuconolactone decarboxylase